MRIGKETRLSAVLAALALAAITAGGAAASTQAAPKNTTPPKISGTFAVGQTVTTSNGTWSGSPTSYSYRWDRCDSHGASCSTIAGANGSSYKLTSADQGHMVQAFVTATNADGSATAAAAPEGPISPATPPAAAPVNTAPPTISGTPDVGQTLTVSPGTWSGSKPITYKYQWESCDKNGANCTDLAGATSSTYTVQTADAGSTMRVLVTASNSAGSSSSTSVPSAQIPAVTAGAVSLQANRTLIVYGTSVLFSGTVANGKAGETVTIKGHQSPYNQSKQLLPVADVQTQAGGSFSVTLKPKLNTVYYAEIGGQRSQPITVNVRPKLMIAHQGANSFVVHALAARSLAGKFIVVQRWNPRTHVWLSLERLTLRGGTTINGQEILTTVGFKLRIGRVMTRVFMPLGQVAPGYVSTTSSAFTA